MARQLRPDDSAPRRAGDREQLAAMLRAAGSYPQRFTAGTAGPYGCDPCWDCGRRPTEGERVWQNTYGDLYCDGCAERRRVGGGES
jgi:hypothetical protein